MKFRAGLWILIHTATENHVDYLPLQKIAQSNLQRYLQETLRKISSPVLSVRAVLIDIPKESLTSALPNDLLGKTTILLRSGVCDIQFDQSTNVIQVSKEQNGKIRTLIVDDSGTMRTLLRKVLESDSRFEVTHEAGHPREALELIRKHTFDLITMDLHLPEMTGADVIKSYMPQKPIPTVVISSLRPEESELVLQSLENGAIDYIQKPEQRELATAKDELLSRISAVAKAQVGQKRGSSSAKTNLRNQAGLLAIGASTGGTEAIKVLLSQMGDHVPPTLIVQHIPPVFSKAFAERLNRQFAFEVKEAEDGDLVQADRVLIAPGGFQMKLVSEQGTLRVRIAEEPPVNRHKPSVDVLFDSIAKTYKGPVVGVLLTGMGADGARGLVNMKSSGAFTIAQDDTTSVVFGMPREAILRGGATEVCEIFNMGTAIQRGFSKVS